MLFCYILKQSFVLKGDFYNNRIIRENTRRGKENLFSSHFLEVKRFIKVKKRFIKHPIILVSHIAPQCYFYFVFYKL